MTTPSRWNILRGVPAWLLAMVPLIPGIIALDIVLIACGVGIALIGLDIVQRAMRPAEGQKDEQ